MSNRAVPLYTFRWLAPLAAWWRREPSRSGVRPGILTGFLHDTARAAPDEITMRLYVGNLPYSADDNTLRTMFEPHGTITDVRMVVDRETGRSRGFGFVEFETSDEGNKAIEAMNGTDVDGRSIVVNEARERQERSGGGGGGGGRGGGW